MTPALFLSTSSAREVCRVVALPTHAERATPERNRPFVVPALCSNSLATVRGWCSHCTTAVAEMLSLVRPRRLREKFLNRARSLCPTLLLKLVYPVGDSVDHIAGRFLGRLYGRLRLLTTIFLTIALVALDNFYRGFLGHDDFNFLPLRLLTLALFNEFPSREFNFCSLERPRAPYLANPGPETLLPNKNGQASSANTDLDAHS